MCKRWFIGALALLVCVSATGSAQTAEVDQPVQLTFSVAGTANIYPYPVWNGAEWAVAYMRIYGEVMVYIARCTEDGGLIEGHELFGKEKNYGYYIPLISAYENGWALTLTKRRYGHDTDDRTAYFVLLNKQARKTGVEVALFSHKRGGIIQAVPVGQFFVVFYRTPANSGFDAIHMAFIDRQGKRVVPDRKITTPAGEHHIVLNVTPTSEGFALMGVTADNFNYKSTFFMLVGLDGTQLVKLTKINNNGLNFWTRSAVWDGTAFAIAATENLSFEDNDLAPFTRMLAMDGAWQGGGTRHLPPGFNFHLGLGYDGGRYVAMVANRNGTVWCQELDSNLHNAGPKVMIDDSAFADPNSAAACAGSMTGFFAAMFKVLGGQTANIYYTRIQLPHTGKPDIDYFNGKVHEFNGKKYVLLVWLAAGTQQITMKTKGRRWKLSPYGFHAVEIAEKSRFKVVATNDSGSAKAKVKITP